MARGDVEARLGEQIRALFEAGPLAQAGDDRLLDQFQGGEPGRSGSAFAALVDRHGPMVLGVCRRVLADPGLAEDAFQATFLVLARRARSVRDREALAPWLHRVARRVATRAKVRADRARRRERPGPREVAVLDPDRLERAEVRAIIDEEVDRLGDHQRLPVVLCCLEGLSHEEASARLDWPLGTVKSRLARGRRRLQERLTRRGVAPALAAATAWESAGAGAATATSAVPVPPALAGAAARLGLLVLGPATPGSVPAAVSALAREELGSMLKVKVVAATLAAGASIALVGLALGSGPPRPTQDVPAAPAPALKARPAAPRKPGEVLIRAVDPEGRPVPVARVDVRELSRGFNPEPGSTDSDGMYTVTGLPTGNATVVDVLAAGRSLGATAEVTGADEAGPDRGVQEVRLGPLVRVTGRVLDQDGKPITAPTVNLWRDVSYRSQNERSFRRTVATWDKVQIEGIYTFEGLIPGATYSPHAQARGYTTATFDGVKLEPGQATRFRDIRLILADREVNGIVVDPKGRPAAKVTVDYQWSDPGQALYAPKGATWFHDTDASGRFHLTGLPRGPIRVIAFRRNPDEQHRNIRNLKYADIPQGSDEVRIELPDPDDRLRGIE